MNDREPIQIAASDFEYEHDVFYGEDADPNGLGTFWESWELSIDDLRIQITHEKHDIEGVWEESKWWDVTVFDASKPALVKCQKSFSSAIDVVNQFLMTRGDNA